MAAPMREGAPAGGPRPAPAHHVPAHPANFEYDDNEWDIGIGDLIIDLDADIEKTDGGGGGGMAARAEPDAQRTALKMKIKRTKPGTKSSEAKHEIVKSNEMNGESKPSAPARDQQPAQQPPQPPLQPQPPAPPAGAPPAPPAHPAAAPHAAVKRGSGGHRRDKTRDKHPHAAPGPGPPPPGAPHPPPHVQHVQHPPHPQHDINGATRPTPAAPNAPGPPAPVPPAPPPKLPDSGAPAAKPPAPAPPPPAKPEPSKPAVTAVVALAAASAAAPAPALAAAPSPAPPAGSAATKPEPEEPRRDASPAPPPAKKHKPEPKETTEVCVGTSVGTITEPDCLGPCEPGTSVTLEGIVWHETEGGVLVVNVTWRGKTYVGTLLDCTRHDWAPPRFCDSPTEELDARTPKGRAKRGRGAIAPDLANFTETRSSVHSKLRNGGGKGRRAQPSPTPFTPPPRADPSAGKRRLPPVKSDEEPSSSAPKAKRAAPPPSSPPPDPVLLECPEPNCSKKYKHANGLKYHRSHAHGSPDDDDKDASGSEAEEPSTAPPSPAQPPTPAPVTPARSPDKALKSPEKPEPTPASPVAPAPPTPPAEKLPAALKPTALRFSVEEFPPASPFPPAVADTVTPHVAPMAAGLAFAAATIGVPVGMPPPHPAPVGLEPSSPTTPLPPVVPLTPIPAEASPRGPSTAPSPQFKVKPTASLMPAEDRKTSGSPADESPGGSSRRARGRRSPGVGGSPHPPERSFGREGVRSPAYSDISDDAAPSEEGAPGEPGDKPEPPPHVPPSYPVYQYYGQPPYLVSAAAAEASKAKEDAAKALEQKRPDKECGKSGVDAPPPPQKMLPQHFYPYGYIPPGFPYNVEPSYPPAHQAPPPALAPPAPDDKSKDGGGERCKGSPGPGELGKPPPSVSNKPKPHDPLKDPSKHPNENHQILKESIEMKSQMNPYVYQQRQPHPRDDEVRRYYMSLEQQRRKEMGGPGLGDMSKPGGGGVSPALPPRLPPPGIMKPISKEMGKDEPKMIVKEEPKIKQEGQKPTMETTGPPPPPTSQYYLPPYMQGPHYGALPFDSVYRSGINPMLVSAPFGGWGGVGLPRYHAPEDLSRPPPAPKPLDLLPSYYPPHKIHELSDHAKSPPSKAGGGGGAPPAAGAPPPPGKPPQPPRDGSPKEASRSPPPQRHVHTHHHTHVGLGYPLYPAPYGAAVLASQQAVAGSFPTTK